MDLNPSLSEDVRWYYEGLISPLLSAEIDRHIKLNTEALGEIALASSRKFFSLFPGVYTLSQIQRINEVLHTPDPLNPTIEDVIVTTAGNIARSVALQLVYLKVWGLFIDSLNGEHCYGTPTAYAIANLEQVRAIEVNKGLGLRPKDVVGFIEQLAPIFNKVCHNVRVSRERSPTDGAEESTASAAAGAGGPGATHVERLFASRTEKPLARQSV